MSMKRLVLTALAFAVGASVTSRCMTRRGYAEVLDYERPCGGERIRFVAAKAAR